MGWPNCWMRHSIITKRSHPSNSQQLVWCHGTYAYLSKNLKTPSDPLAHSPKTTTQKMKVGEERKSYWKIIRPHTKRKKKTNTILTLLLGNGRAGEEKCCWFELFGSCSNVCARLSLLPRLLSLSQSFPVGAPLLFSCSNYLTPAACQTASPPSLFLSAPHQHPPLIRHLCRYLNPVSSPLSLALITANYPQQKHETALCCSVTPTFSFFMSALWRSISPCFSSVMASLESFPPSQGTCAFTPTLHRGWIAHSYFNESRAACQTPVWHFENLVATAKSCQRAE